MPQLSKREIASKKRQAVHLFLVKGYQQKEIARNYVFLKKQFAYGQRNTSGTTGIQKM